MKIGDLVRHGGYDFRHGVVIKAQTISSRSRLLYVVWTNGRQGWCYDHDLEALCK
jgi:hypothetical protein